MKELDFQKIGKKIKKRRLELNIKQERVAELLDVNPSHVSNIERGKANPSLTALVNMANILSCSVDLFLDEEYDYPEQNHDIDAEILKILKNSDDEFKQKVFHIIKLIK